MICNVMYNRCGGVNTTIMIHLLKLGLVGIALQLLLLLYVICSMFFLL